MKKLLLILVIAGLGTLHAQMDDATIPEIPDTMDSEPPTPSMTLPSTSKASTAPTKPAPTQNTQTQTPSSSSSASSYSSASSASTGADQDVTVKAEVPKDIGGSPVFNPAQDFMDHFKFEAIFSSRSWWNYWWSPDMGLMRVTSLPQPVQTPRGVLMRWKRDSLGNPMAYLRALVQFPRLKTPDAVSAEQPLSSVPITISQAVVFYQRPGGWMASASPIYVTMAEADKKVILAPVQRGQAVWRAWVGHGGIYVENFIGAGLAAARTELNQYFRDEEIRLFTQGNSDVIFYLRPQDALMVKTASK